MSARSTRLRPGAAVFGAGSGRDLPVTGPLPLPIVGGLGLLALPFDALRLQYAGAVMAGLAQRSILASGQAERMLDALEKLILGSLARQR